jgi:UDP-GlcNAc:undecaprenyl-phosphate/decaprenyl-phosphate GlcNAc-1-phosphate transferase
MESFTQQFIVFALSLFGSTALMPLLISFAKRHQLLDIPNLRSSHIIQVPRIGGVVFFVATVVFLLQASSDFDEKGLALMSAGAVLLFAVGLYDDLKSVKPMIKMLAQIIALFGMVRYYHDAIESFRLASLFELIPPGVFQVLVFGFFLVLINAINLIDGIDGLAGLISINFFAVMALFFYRSEHAHFGLLSLVLIGSIMAFLFFNLSKRQKVFMGDCGSLLLGYLMCGFSLQFMESCCCGATLNELSGNELALLFLALFSLPVFDLLRVMALRLYHGQQIFQADRNHLHHVILDKTGKSHLFTAALLFTIHMSIIVLSLVAMNAVGVPEEVVLF